ncbi:hypothetical protein [Sansalvadorimonas verongulae]|uniref:hypothetical protein n=1 Tax=Sansalvadorimonas verongulae TaxID=2172824 RepID=UPI001E5C80A1|nr:hypothetical protein [Sansalvadorimonas verongulae]MTI12703.1 hypothetical protein [Sansalvadorimonas verongulae]
MSDELLYALSEAGDFLIEKATRRKIPLRRGAKKFFAYVVAELRKTPDLGADFSAARKYAEYGEDTDGLGKMWTKNSDSRKIIKLVQNRLFFVPYDSPECSANTK